MTVAEGSLIFLGTDESTGVTITTGSTTTGAEVDAFGANTMEGWGHFFLKYTGTTAAGTIDISIIYARISGQNYSDQVPVVASIIPINGTEKIPLGDFPLGRFMELKVKNNGIGTSITNVTVSCEKFLES